MMFTALAIIELAAVGGMMLAAAARNHGLRAARPEYRRNALGAALGAVVASLFVVVAGSPDAMRAGGGLYWLFPAVVLAFAVGLFNAWVALVEILR
jgi:peptidoglycan/LPS O-acetylase OafA/YrhL